MISDDEIAAILRAAELARRGGRLAGARGEPERRAGTTSRSSCSALEEGEAAAEADEDTLSGTETIHQGLTADDVQAAVAEQERAGQGGRRPTQRRGVRPAPVRPRAGRERVGWSAILVALVVVAAIGAAAVLGARQVYFVGTDDAGLVTLYRGVPYELPFGIELYSRALREQRARRARSRRARRERVLDHEWRSREDAEDLVRQLEQGTLDLGTRR